ncbi:DUF6134 family protein [Hanamia caeni]|nr:DUF6134 family protein [Hanamia caeni]
MKVFTSKRKSINDPVECVIIFLLIIGLLLIAGNLKQNFSWQIVYGYLFFLGWFSWTFVEYMFHRFVCHSKPINSANSKKDTFSHMHHHQHPTEIRLSTTTRFILIAGSLILIFFSIWLHDYFTIIVGFVCGFTIYNLTHWILHQKFSQKIFAKKVRYHIYHHCRYPQKCFGISITWWDDLFGTAPQKQDTISPKVVDLYFGKKIKKESVLKKEVLISALLLCAHFYSPAQEKVFQYDVIKNGNVIGFVNVSEKNKGNMLLLELKSTVKTTWLAFQYTSNITEKVVFEDGVMVYSFYYKNENGRETRVEAKKAGQYMNIVDNGHLDFNYQAPVTYNTVQLYCGCPGMDTKVYSNQFQQFLDIKKVAANRYRLRLPGNNYSYFNYKKGRCTQVDVERVLFTIHFVLRKETKLLQ